MRDCALYLYDKMLRLALSHHFHQIWRRNSELFILVEIVLIWSAQMEVDARECSSTALLCQA